MLPYPAILVANVMSMAAEGPRGLERVKAAAPFALLSLYPVVWIVLFKWSWRAMGRGQTGLALVLSSVPSVLIAIGLGSWFASERPRRKAVAANETKSKAACPPKTRDILVRWGLNLLFPNPPAMKRTSGVCAARPLSAWIANSIRVRHLLRSMEVRRRFTEALRRSMADLRSPAAGRFAAFWGPWQHWPVSGPTGK